MLVCVIKHLTVSYDVWNFASFYDLPLDCETVSDGVVCFVFHFITYKLFYHELLCVQFLTTNKNTDQILIDNHYFILCVNCLQCKASFNLA